MFISNEFKINSSGAFPKHSEHKTQPHSTLEPCKSF